MKRNITVGLEQPLYELITRAAKRERLSRTAWMAVAAEEKLGMRPRLELARPAEGEIEENGDAA